MSVIYIFASFLNWGQFVKKQEQMLYNRPILRMFSSREAIKKSENLSSSVKIVENHGVAQIYLQNKYIF